MLVSEFSVKGVAKAIEPDVSHSDHEQTLTRKIEAVPKYQILLLKLNSPPRSKEIKDIPI